MKYLLNKYQVVIQTTMATTKTNDRPETNTQLSRTPIKYEAVLSSSGLYEDDVLKKYKSSEFEDFGVKCPCCKTSKTIHRNIYTFKYSHCKSKKHMDYIEKLNKDILNTTIDDTKSNNKEYEKINKSLKVQMVKEHQNYLIEKQRNETLKSQLKDIITENDELCKEKKQKSYFINQLVKTNKSYSEKLKQYENLTKMMMKIEGYEIENDNNVE